MHNLKYSKFVNIMSKVLILLFFIYTLINLFLVFRSNIEIKLSLLNGFFNVVSLLVAFFLYGLVQLFLGLLNSQQEQTQLHRQLLDKMDLLTARAAKLDGEPILNYKSKLAQVKGNKWRQFD